MKEINKKHITKVIYRQWKIGCEIIALFPEIPGDNQGFFCLSYMRQGQHGSANPGIIRDTKPVKDKDYESLHKELKSLGYELKIVKKFTQKSRKIRTEQNRTGKQVV